MDRVGRLVGEAVLDPRAEARREFGLVAVARSPRGDGSDEGLSRSLTVDDPIVQCAPARRSRSGGSNAACARRSARCSRSARRSVGSCSLRAWRSPPCGGTRRRGVSRRTRHSSATWAANSGVGPGVEHARRRRPCRASERLRDLPLPSRLPPLSPHQVDRLALGDDDEDLPEVVAVGEPGELPALGPPIEAVEGAQRDVLLVRDRPGDRPQLRPRQLDEAMDVGIPELIGRGPIPLLEQLDAARDRSGRRHQVGELPGPVARSYGSHPRIVKPGDRRPGRSPNSFATRAGLLAAAASYLVAGMVDPADGRVAVTCRSRCATAFSGEVPRMQGRECPGPPGGPRDESVDQEPAARLAAPPGLPPSLFWGAALLAIVACAAVSTPDGEAGAGAGGPKKLPLHASRIDGLAFSPDGRLVASASSDGTTKICDLATHRERQVGGRGTSGVHLGRLLARRPDESPRATSTAGSSSRIAATAGRSGRSGRSRPRAR